ncbi:MAG TPA: MFS transporter [Actinomycetales bacterium]|nr:MFS transporter [Actinomycetales bacterium]
MTGYLADLRIVLRGRDFRRLFTTRLLSQAGDGAFQVGLASLFFFSPERQATTQAAAVAFAITLLPYSVVGPFAGVLLDRWHRRQVLLFSNLLRAVIVGGTAALVLNGSVGVPLYLLALVCLSVNRFFLAGLGASLPHVVPERQLVMANSLTPTAGTMALMAGAAAGYGMRALFGAGDSTDGAIIVVGGLAYLLSALAASRMRIDLLGPDDDTRLHAVAWRSHVVAVVSELGQALRHIRVRRTPAHGLGVIAVHRLAYGLVTVASILLCRNYFNAPQQVDAGLALLAQVVAVTGAGFAAAAVITPAVTRRLGIRLWIVVCLLAAGISQVAFAWRFDVPALLITGFVVGLGGQGAKICVDAIVQIDVDDAFRGRVFSLYDMLFNGAFVVAGLLAVLFMPQDGDSPAVFLTVAGLYLLAALGYAAVSTRRSSSGVATAAAQGRTQ